MKKINRSHIVPMLIGVVLTMSLTGLHATYAWANDQELNELQKRIDTTAQSYDSAEANLEKIHSEAQAVQQELLTISSELPAKEQDALKAVRNLYKFNQESPTFITLMLSTDNFQNFFAMVNYLKSFQLKQMNTLEELSSVQKDLQTKSSELTKKEAEATKLKETLAQALTNAKLARKEAQARAEEELRRQAKEAQEALEKARKAQQEKKNEFKSNSNEKSNIEVPSTSESANEIDWSQDKKEFVKKWAPRIDKYLAGSPMKNTGETFARAAWDYGVDPRWSPAIATIESSKGRAIPNKDGHNAWGWTKRGGGFRTFSSWEEGARKHVAYLAEMYGSTLTPRAAQIYCPPSWQYWYSSVLAQMQKI